MKIYIETQRLLLRSWSEQDLAAYILLNADPEVMEFFPSTLSPSESIAHQERIQEHFAAYNFGAFAVEHTESKKFIGFVGLQHVDMNQAFCPTIEIGWRLAKESWGQGFATEAAKACIAFAFNDLGLSLVHSFTALINKRSERIMQKIGMSKIDEFMHPKIESSHILCPHALYEITKNQFFFQG